MVTVCAVFASRDELYPMPYSSIDWNAARSQIAKEDLYYPHPLLQVTGGGGGREAEGKSNGPVLKRVLTQNDDVIRVLKWVL